MRITIIGGHGKVALELHPLLVQAGHEVDAIIRRPDQAAEIEAAGANPVVADVQEQSVQELTTLLSGSDLVVWAAGAGGGDPDRTFAVDRDAAIHSMDAAAAAGVGRYIMVSYLGAREDHGVPEGDSFFPYAESKAAADAHLRGSSLAWTIVAPGALTTSAPTGHLDVVSSTSESGGRGEVSRADVARVIAAIVERDDQDGVMLEFVNGPTPIEQALDEAAGVR